MLNAIVNGLIAAQMALTRRTVWKSLMRAAERPKATQHEVLQSIISRHRDTKFGREHGFDRINSYQDFVRHVPLQSYEALQPYYEEQEATGEQAITTEQAVMYVQTTGTTGPAKFFPITPGTMERMAIHRKILSYSQYRHNPAAFSGKLFAIVNPAVKGHTQHGTPYGWVSGMEYKGIPKIVRTKYVVPVEVFIVEDYDVKYKLLVRLALACKGITHMAAANPSMFVFMQSLLDRYIDEYIDDIEQGGFREYDRLPEETRAAVAPRLKADKRRAQELRALALGGRRSLNFADVWPGLQAVLTWTGGSCGIHLAALKPGLPSGCTLVNLGYTSSEMRGTITIDIDNDLGLPTLQDTFFEFVERDRWQAGREEFLTLEELVEGQEYYVFITTGTGIYRYSMNDIVRVTGKIEQTPTLQFLQKGQGFTDISNEKLSETQVMDALRVAEREFGFTSAFFIMLADPVAAGYELCLETTREFERPLEQVRDCIEAALGRLNLNYTTPMTPLRPLILKRLRNGTGQAYKKKCLADGQEDAQFKVLTLQYKDKVKFAFEDYVCASAAGQTAGSIK